MGSLLMGPKAPRALLRSGLAPGALPTPALLPTPVLFPTPVRWLLSSSRARPPPPTSCSPRCARWRAAPTATRTPAAPRRAIFSSSFKVVRDYEHLPRSYRDQEGLAFARWELGIFQTRRIFGPGLSGQEANQLLRILHGRRVAGTLMDPAFAVHTARFTPEQIAMGLQYLRETVPVNETLNAGLRAEDELDQLERQEQELQRKSKKKKKAGGATEATEAAAATDDYKPDPIYGRSMLDEMRARNAAKDKARKAAMEEERRRTGGTEVAGPLAVPRREPRLPTNPAIAEHYKKAQSDMKAPPQLTAWQRILPSVTAVALVLGFLAAVCTVYEEPMPRYRLLPHVSASEATVGAIIAVNTLVCLGWRVPQLWPLFNRYMILVVATVKPVTLFTAIFSHQTPQHMLFNMVPLWLVGTRLHEELGRAEFLTLYVGCGAVGFLGSLVSYTLRGWLKVTSLGASGGTLGLLAAYFWEHRNDGFRLFGMPRDGVHGVVFLGMLVAAQLSCLGTTARLGVDFASHLVGMAAGLVGVELISRCKGVATGTGTRTVTDFVSAPADASRGPGPTGEAHEEERGR